MRKFHMDQSWKNTLRGICWVETVLLTTFRRYNLGNSFLDSFCHSNAITAATSHKITEHYNTIADPPNLPQRRWKTKMPELTRTWYQNRWSPTTWDSSSPQEKSSSVLKYYIWLLWISLFHHPQAYSFV